MGFEPTDQEVDAVLKLDGETRYRYTLKKITDFGELWSVSARDGWCLGLALEGNETVPIWPAASYAQRCCTGEWKDCQPKNIDLDVWQTRWIPGMLQHNRTIAVFPVPRGKSVVVGLSRFMADLKEELEKYDI